MSKKTDVIVIGSGLAGLMAALSASKKGCRVSVFSFGRGALAIGPGIIDLLGYDYLGNPLQNPWDGFDSLPAQHPYSLLGAANVQAGIQALVDAVAGKAPLSCSTDSSGKPVNALVPTIMGTLKPTYLYQGETDPRALLAAKKILVLTVTGFRDCKPALIIQQLRRYPQFQDTEFATFTLPSPFSEKGRSLNALDLAHVADREAGLEWFLNALRDRGKGYDLALLPPMLGARAHSSVGKLSADALGCPILELVSVPPGVGGLRIRDALMEDLRNNGVSFYENANVLEGKAGDDGRVHISVLASGRRVEHESSAAVVASGGIIDGGVILGPGSARESVFGINIPVPEDVDQWSEPEIFGQHLVTRLGVTADSSLRALGRNGEPIYQNVFFAGRTLGGYDYASEKSGNGVAAATGWKAGEMAASIAAAGAGDEK